MSEQQTNTPASPAVVSRSRFLRRRAHVEVIRYKRRQGLLPQPDLAATILNDPRLLSRADRARLIPLTPESIAAAKQAQAVERALVKVRTGQGLGSNT